MNEKIKQDFLAILEEELIPAMGCTEPIALAYAAARGREVLGRDPEGILARCSGNIIKNVRCVRIPNSGGMTGIEAACTLGALCGDPNRNMEVLEAYLAQPQFLYKGEPRRIIFSEQGFNSPDGPLKKLREKQAAAGFTLAYLKARNMKSVDMMYNHAFSDNPHEFGLHLGIHEYDESAPDHIGKARPIAASVRAMDTPGEDAAIAFAREVIGDDMFDYMLNPAILCGDPDTSSETDFGTNDIIEKPE